MKTLVKQAFVTTIPVMLGYVFVGIAFGLLSEKLGYNLWWAALMSVTIYAGSMQFVILNLLAGGVGLIQVAITTFIVNIRHALYGITFLEEFKSMKKKKPYMIFSLTDETYALLCSTSVPEGIHKGTFFFTIAFFNQLYWIAGSIFGAVAGSYITFNTSGIEFAMTALFVVICVEQLLTYPSSLPSIIGITSAILCLGLFGPSNMLIPSMFVIILLLIPSKRKLQLEEEEAETACL